VKTGENRIAYEEVDKPQSRSESSWKPVERHRKLLAGVSTLNTLHAVLPEWCL
jgi:hypothetical protein